MRRLTAACLALCLTAVCLLQPLGILAATVLTGTVVGIETGHKLYVRKEPSTSTEVLDKLSNGTVVSGVFFER